MKRKYIFIATLLVLFGIIALQSCQKDQSATPGKVYLAAVPGSPAPAVDGILAFTGTGQTINLTWSGTATNAISWDVYFGNTASPAKVASGITTNAYTATITKGGTYYWKVVTVDANNVKSTSSVWSFEVNSNPAVPTIVAPALNATNVSCNPTITWAATDPEGDALTYDLYLGKTATPGIYSAGLADPTFAVSTTLTATTDYYWQIVVHDPYGGTSTGPVWKFTTGALPISKFTGAYTADEPAEAYNYPISFTFATAATIKTTNYWNSTWPATFTLDLTKLTYTMSAYTFSAGWTGIESGIIDPATGTMTGTYTLWKNNVIQEQGVHTYTKN
jgi:hypothetical protein